MITVDNSGNVSFQIMSSLFQHINEALSSHINISDVNQLHPINIELK